MVELVVGLGNLQAQIACLRTGLVTRTVIPETPIRTEYALSEVGESLMPVIDSMVEWGSGYQRLVRKDG